MTNTKTYKEIVDTLYSISNGSYQTVCEIEKNIEQFPAQYRDDILESIKLRKRSIEILTNYW